MTTYIKLPNNWFVSVPATLLAEYAILQMYLDRDGFVSSVQGLGPLSTFVEWLSSSAGFNAGHLGFAIGIHVFEGIFAFKLARYKNLNLMSCIFWFVQTLIIGVGSFEVKFITVIVRLTLIHRYCVSMKLHQIQRNKIILNLRVSAGGFFYLVSGLSLVALHIPLTTPFLHLLTVRISIFVK